MDELIFEKQKEFSKYTTSAAAAKTTTLTELCYQEKLVLYCAWTAWKIHVTAS